MWRARPTLRHGRVCGQRGGSSPALRPGPAWSSVLRRGPLCGPSVALATHPHGEEKHLPPSSSACHASSCPAQVPSILGLLTTPCGWGCPREGAHQAGTGSASSGAWAVSPLSSPHPGPPSSLYFLPGESQVLFLAGHGQCGLRRHSLEAFLSKAHLIPLLRRLQGWGWHGARMVEAIEPATGKPSLIKANPWPIQRRPGSC